MTSPLLRGAARAALVVLVVLLGACRSSGSSSFLIFGGASAPHEHLVARVRASHEELEKARAEFAEAFQLYQRLTSPQAVDLEDLRADFGDALEDCGERAKSLAKRVEAVRTEKQRLFEGWNAQLARFSSDALREKSEAQMIDSEKRAQRVLAALDGAQERMSPVVLKLQDYDLFFHHNLNARALATLQDTYKDFDAEYRALERQFEETLGATKAFLAYFAEPAEPASAPEE